MVICCAAAAAYSGDGVFHTFPGATVAGAAPSQLCQLPILLAGPYAHAGPAPALPCHALLLLAHAAAINALAVLPCLLDANWDFVLLH